MTQSHPFTIGLTGSIGMGKTTTAAMFAEFGCAVWDADSAVHRLYEVGGAGVTPIAALRPEAIIGGAVSHTALKDWIGSDAKALSKIEAEIHPLVAADRRGFLRTVGAEIVVLDIPLLFETDAQSEVDLVVVVSAPASLQQSRVLARPGMTKALFQTISAKQIPDTQKQALADVVIRTETLAEARTAVQSLISRIKEQLAGA